MRVGCREGYAVSAEEFGRKEEGGKRKEERGRRPPHTPLSSLSSFLLPLASPSTTMLRRCAVSFWH
jgi:hypothetical protein